MLRTMPRWPILCATLGASLCAGTIATVYPALAWTQPLFAYAAGFLCAVAIADR